MDPQMGDTSAGHYTHYFSGYIFIFRVLLIVILTPLLLILPLVIPNLSQHFFPFVSLTSSLISASPSLLLFSILGGEIRFSSMRKTLLTQAGPIRMTIQNTIRTIYYRRWRKDLLNSGIHEAVVTGGTVGDLWIQPKRSR